MIFSHYLRRQTTQKDNIVKIVKKAELGLTRKKLATLYLSIKATASIKVLALVVIGIARWSLETNSNLNEHSNEFTTKSSVTIRYGQPKFSLGEFQVHSARNSLKFRFNFGNLLTLKK